MLGALSDERLGMEGDSQAGGGEHRKIICAIAHGDGLLQRNVFLGGDFLEQLGFALCVDNLTFHAPGHHAIHNFQVVGSHIVDPQLLLKVTAEVGESTGDDRGFIAE